MWGHYCIMSNGYYDNNDILVIMRTMFFYYNDTVNINDK